MSIWSIEEREEINKVIQYEEELNQLAYKAYAEVKKEKIKLKEVLKKEEYKPLTNYYSYDVILNDLLKYEV